MPKYLAEVLFKNRQEITVDANSVKEASEKISNYIKNNNIASKVYDSFSINNIISDKEEDFEKEAEALLIPDETIELEHFDHDLYSYLESKYSKDKINIELLPNHIELEKYGSCFKAIDFAVNKQENSLIINFHNNKYIEKLLNNVDDYDLIIKKDNKTYYFSSVSFDCLYHSKEEETSNCILKYVDIKEYNQEKKGDYIFSLSNRSVASYTNAQQGNDLLLKFKNGNRIFNGFELDSEKNTFVLSMNVYYQHEKDFNDLLKTKNDTFYEIYSSSNELTGITNIYRVFKNVNFVGEKTEVDESLDVLTVHKLKFSYVPEEDTLEYKTIDTSLSDFLDKIKNN